jgi:nitrite reductase (NADH) small subunit
MSEPRHRVCRASELQPGEHRIVEIDGKSIGVYNLGGRYFALLNRCPHKGAPLCRGRTTGLISGPAPGEFAFERDGEILRCPWHGWEFDIPSGKSVFNPHKVRAKTYPVAIEPGDEDESVPTFPTSVHGGWVTVQLRRPRDPAAHTPRTPYDDRGQGAGSAGETSRDKLP